MKVLDDMLSWYGEDVKKPRKALKTAAKKGVPGTIDKQLEYKKYREGLRSKGKEKETKTFKLWDEAREK